MPEATAKPPERPAPESAPHGSAIRQAIDEVMQITDSLRHALDQMEEVLELVELAERQKLGDEREIEGLRRALRQLQRPRGAHASEDESRRS
jgi:beta-phosphoglucomutase-like phosphatase (HAD superfamily)